MLAVLASHTGVLVLVSDAPIPLQLPASAPEDRGEDGPSTWALPSL